MTTLLQSRRFWFGFAFVMLAVAAGCAALQYFPTQPVVRNIGDPAIVRGYLAVAVGRSAEAESGGIYSRAYEAQDIHLPGVTVYLDDAAGGGAAGPAVRTDLSGRFTLHAPKDAKYRLCWKSEVYGGACMQTPFRAGHEPLFLSTQRVQIARRDGHVASFGKVRFTDDSPARTLEPFADINSFAVVRLLDRRQKVLAEVPVNNQGNYLLPYLPSTEPVTLVAAIEKSESALLVLPDTYVNNPRLVRFHLTLQNTPPRLLAITPLDAAGSRVQVAAPGQTLRLRAETRDRDGDPVAVRWLVNPGSGTVSAPAGAQVEWTLPAQAGRHSVMAIAADGRGGYARYTVRLPVGAPGVAFGGVVAGTDGTLLGAAEVEINGKVEKTDAQGRFIAHVPEAGRYVFNIRKPGYGFYSRIYDRSVAGGRWTLVAATVAEFDPKLPIAFDDKRAPRNCPGADSAGIVWEQSPMLRRVYWQDGKGNNVAPPIDSEQSRRAILPWQSQRGRKSECGPGIAVRIPANALQTAGGAAPAGNVELSLATVDVGTPEQMPGDDSVRIGGPTPGWMISYGAGSIALRDSATGRALNLKPGAAAEVAIPVDPGQLAVGGSLPATAPLLYYDEAQGLWQQDGVLTLDAAKKNYVAKVTHFSSLNTDLVKTNPSCVRVQSTIPTPYEMEVTIPLGGGLAPKVKQLTISDAPPHVIYNLPNHTPITIVAIAPGSPGVPPRSLGVFIVDTGPPQAAGFGSPPPAAACATEVALSVQTFPEVPASGQFLHGLFAFSATTLNESDLGTPGSLSQLLDQATNNYYAQVDPTSERTTLTGFLGKNGFTRPPQFQLCAGVPCVDPDVEINAVFANGGDLGFGRDMHCRRSASGAGFDHACYVSNYGDITTDDALDAQNARTNTGLVATVAMEYSRVANGDPIDDRHVKFYVYNAAGNRVNRADLDGKGLRPVPQLCMVCHGGAYPGGGTTGVPAFSTAASVKLGSRFLPFDNRFYTYPASPNKAAQQAAIKHLNEDIVQHAPSVAPAPDAIATVIAAMYAGGATTQHEEFVVDGWKQGTLPNTAAQEQFYRRVLGNACRTCHIAQPFANASSERAGVDLQFRSARDFLRSQPIAGGGSFSPFSAAEQRVCVDHVMPHAKRTHDIFWGQYWPSDFGALSPTLPAQFQTFGDTIKALPRPAGWPAAEVWPPAWNGQLCGQYTSAGSTPPSFYSTHVHLLWSRDWNNGIRCTTCHAALSGNATDTHNALLGTGLFGGGPDVVANNTGASILHQRVTGSAGARMPQSCPAGSPQRRCLNQAGGVYNPAASPTLTTDEIDRIDYWINHGAAP